MGKDTKEKESKCKYPIDYEKSIIDNKFQRLQKTGEESFTPILIKCWIIYINPKDSASLNKIIKDKFSLDSTDFRHLKKFNKYVVEDRENKEKKVMRLKCLLCSLDYINDKSTIEQILSDGGIVYDKIDIADIPKNKPFDKDVNREWSERYWPILTIVSIFVDPIEDKIKGISFDERNDLNPVGHSIMNCIDNIAESELQRRHQLKSMIDKPQESASGESPPDGDIANNNYLCLNYHVYTTHEPCTMCSMALIHSRISKLVYIKDSPVTGSINPSSGNGYCIQKSCILNWKYEAWKYIGDDELINSGIKLIDDDCINV
ncbi:hypothetical protein B5S33_g3909 [[Candida] boidinii]|nr:hypothetical protein B5S27_g1522 [[Candida] boidinii]OWB85248.1 hypothetical protein B5S33_g3909 [[Candida] boidinii]